jgi:dipeptidyl aminopeptidase/acylaminoacyl peptidase
MTPAKTQKPYGSWDSPITPASMAGGIRLSDCAWAEDGSLLWLEGRSDRSLLVVQPPGEGPAQDVDTGFNVRARVGYGGGDFAVDKNYIYFVAADTGRILRQSIGESGATSITPAFGRAAAPTLSPDGQWLLFIHSYEEQDCLGIIDTAGKHWPQKLASGDDFYMQPAWHPDGRQVAWISWNHPNMPWDGTFLHLGRLAFSEQGLPSLSESEIMAGDEQTAIFQPEFSPDGRFLAYVSDTSGWWHIQLADLRNGATRPLTLGEAEHGNPAWVQGMRTYQFSPDGKRLFFLRNQAGVISLWQIGLAEGEAQQIDLGEEYTWLEQLAIAADGDQIAMIASGSRTPTRLIVCSASGQVQIRRRTTSQELPLDCYSQPQMIKWRVEDSQEIHGLFYPPSNPAFESSGLPPVVVLVHGGPTGQHSAHFDSQAQFFTSRGYAVLQVNYRGSSGYGRAYRNSLRGMWGVYDVEDVVSGARHLIKAEMVDGDRVVIMGGSAGGYTVLKAMEDYPGFFIAGIDLYGVTDLLSLGEKTHKFEKHYNDALIGPLPEALGLYQERSPLLNADKLQDPLAIFQGADDEMVVPSQSADLAAALSSKGLPHIYEVFSGEGHGFRKSETIAHVYQAIEEFLQKYVVSPNNE